MGRHGAVTFKGNPLTLVGEPVKVGSPAPDFELVCYEAGGMQTIRKADLLGKPAIISVVPSLDTPVCQIQTKTFNHRLSSLGDKVTALTVSLDLPFAMNRFCAPRVFSRCAAAATTWIAILASTGECLSMN